MTIDNKALENKSAEAQMAYHLDSIATLLGGTAGFKELTDADDPNKIVGFVIGPEEMFSGELEVVEGDGLWMPMQKPKQLN
jgi:hypothetical protein